MDLFDFFGHRLIFCFFRRVNRVGGFDALHIAVGRNRDDIQLVNFVELVGLGHTGTRHTGNLVVQLEKVLKRNGGESLCFLFDFDPFFGLHRLVQTVTPLTPIHETTRELIDDDHFAVLDDVVDISLVEVMGLKGVIDHVRPVHVAGRVKTLDTRHFFRSSDTCIRQSDRMIFFIDLKVVVFFQLGGDSIRLLVLLGILVGRSRDDQWCSSLVDQNVIDFVNHGIIQRSLSLLQMLGKSIIVPSRRPHIVTQIVEPKLIVGTVGDITGVGFLTIRGGHVPLNRTDGEPQAHVERAHPFHISAGEIIIHRHNMNALAFDRVQVGRQGRDQRLTFTRHHFSNGTAMENHSANQLHIIVPHI